MNPAEILSIINPCDHPPSWTLWRGMLWVGAHGYGNHHPTADAVVWALGHVREVLPLLPREARRTPICRTKLWDACLRRARPVDEERVRSAIPRPLFDLGRGMCVSWHVTGTDDHPGAVAMGTLFGMPQCLITVYEGRGIQ